MSESILKAGVRVLRPSEYDKLKTAINDIENQTKLDILLQTGMRYVEAQRLHSHPEWFQPGNKCIFFPKEAQQKEKRTIPERYIKLTPQATATLPYYFKNDGLPSRDTWNENLKRWARASGIGIEGISAKTTRKTWESWLAAAHPDKIELICLSQGHNTLTSIRHYIGIPFNDTDKVDIRNRVMGWL